METVDIVQGQWSMLGRQTGAASAKLASFCDWSDMTAPKEGGASLPASPKVAKGEAPEELSPKASTMLMARRMLLDTAGSTASTEAPYSSRTLWSPASTCPGSPSPSARMHMHKQMLNLTRRSGTTMTKGNPMNMSMNGSFGAASGQAGPGDADDGDAEAPRVTRKQRMAMGEEIPKPPNTAPHRLDPAFTSMGQHQTRYCNETAVLHGRYAYPSGHENPPVGRYKPSVKIVKDRYPDTEFGMRSRHPSKKVFEVDICTTDPFAHIDMEAPTHSFAVNAGQPPKNGKQGMGLKPGRTETHVIMTEMSVHAKEWCKHDIPSTTRPSDLDVHLDQMLGRKPMSSGLATFFEPGKYSISYDAVDSPIKSGMAMKRIMNREVANSALGFRQPKDILIPEGRHNKKTQPDRSLMRNCSLTNPRITHVSDMDLDTARPPLMKIPPAMYDESDPDASAEWLHRRLTFDASTADHAVVARKNLGMAMHQDIARDDIRGGRLLETDRAALASRRPEAETSIADASVQRSKEAPSNRRADIDVKTFEQYSYRTPTRICGEYSSLSRPRSMAAPEFKRQARRGFKTSQSLGSLKAERRKDFEALPSWSTEMYDEEEYDPPPHM